MIKHALSLSLVFAATLPSHAIPKKCSDAIQISRANLRTMFELQDRYLAGDVTVKSKALTAIRMQPVLAEQIAASCPKNVAVKELDSQIRQMQQRTKYLQGR